MLVRLIGAHDQATPLFLYLAFTAPHTPYQAPPEYLERYKQIENPSRRAYAAMITAMDDQIGRVLQALDARGMRDNTIIIFHSDNGGVKSALLAGQIETKVHFRLITALTGRQGVALRGRHAGGVAHQWPAKIKPATINQPIHVVDYFPTLAKLAGAKAEGGEAAGRRRHMADARPRDRHHSPRGGLQCVEMFPRAVRDGDWKLVWRTTLPNRLELFNLSSDPGEKNNVAGQNSAKAAELQQRVQTLAGEMAKSLFLMETFKAYQSRPAAPMALPNEDAFYDERYSLSVASLAGA